MATLKELQLSRPIGTKFRKNGWIGGCYVVFDGLDWRHSDGEVMNDDQWRAWNPSHTDWTLYTEPKKHIVYLILTSRGSICMICEPAIIQRYRDDGILVAVKKVEITEGEGM